MNLLIYINTLSSGGAERVAVKLANDWSRDGAQVTIVTLACKSLDFYEVNPSIRRICLNMVGNSNNPIIAIFNNLQRVFSLRSILRQIKPDVALAMMSEASVRLSIAALGLPIATVCAERSHPPMAPISKVWNKLRELLYGQVNAVVALTDESAIWLKNNTRARKIYVIPNAVNYPLSFHEPILPVNHVGNPNFNRIIAVGRLVRLKGFALLIQAFSQIASSHPNWELVIIGEGPERSALERQIENSGLTQQVFLPGLAGNIGAWYESAAIYVMTSRYEGFPNTLMEAMAYGLAPISFDCDVGPRNIIRHMVDGILIQPEDVSALNDALELLINDPDFRSRLSERAKDVHVRFSEDRVQGLWKQLFNEVHGDRCN